MSANGVHYRDREHVEYRQQRLSACTSRCLSARLKAAGALPRRQQAARLVMLRSYLWPLAGRAVKVGWNYPFVLFSGAAAQDQRTNEALV